MKTTSTSSSSFDSIQQAVADFYKTRGATSKKMIAAVDKTTKFLNSITSQELSLMSWEELDTSRQLLSNMLLRAVVDHNLVKVAQNTKQPLKEVVREFIVFDQTVLCFDDNLRAELAKVVPERKKGDMNSPVERLLAASEKIVAIAEAIAKKKLEQSPSESECKSDSEQQSSATSKAKAWYTVEKHSLEECADRFDYWMKYYPHSALLSDSEELLNWLRDDSGYKHIRTYEDFCKLAEAVSALGYKIPTLPAEEEFLRAHKKASE